MSVAIRGLSAAAAAALTFGIVTQPSGSAAQTSGHERADGNHSHQRVAVLVRPAKHFNELMRQAHQRIKHQQAVREAKAAAEGREGQRLGLRRLGHHRGRLPVAGVGWRLELHARVDRRL